MINTIKNLIPQGSIFRKKRSWLCAVLAVTGMFLFTAAKQAPNVKTTIISPNESGIKAVIFDVGDVLVTTAASTKASLFIPIVLKNPTLLYKLLSLDAKTEFFKLLDTIPAISTDPVYNKGKQIPLLLADWQSGLQTPQEIKNLANKAIKTSTFSIAEKNLFYAISDLMFNAEKLAASQTLALPMANMLKKLKEAGYRVYILSNWDEDSFQSVYNKYPKLFNLCDEIFISGKEKLSKPNPKFYKKLLDKHNLNPEECIFIDDEPYNIASALKLGLKGIEHKTFSETYKELIKCGLLRLTIQK